MRKFALLGVSALVVVLGVAPASAQPSGENFLTRGDTGADRTQAPNPSDTKVSEGRAVANESSAPTYDAFIWQMHDGA